MNTTNYIGRFAPSPTGKLHFGSLVTALVSFLDAKFHQGQWLVRMEDLDPPRAEAGAASSILKSLEAHSLLWDQDILYQSQRLDAYQNSLSQLKPYTYACECTRKRIISLNGRYDRHCLDSPPNQDKTTAVRLMVDGLSEPLLSVAENFTDLFQGQQTLLLNTIGDVIIKRKDSLFAYQLAVAIDDIYQGITHVLRGYDLLESTSIQRYIMLLLTKVAGITGKSSMTHFNLPIYGHNLLVLGKDGDKLSKQTFAEPLNDSLATDNLITALRFLNHSPPLEELDQYNCKTVLSWAIKNWQPQTVPKQSAVAPLETDG